MFRAFHDFEFDIGTYPDSVTLCGTLMFKASKLNEEGGIIEEEALNALGSKLRHSIDVPKKVTLETLAESVYYGVHGSVPNLYGIKLFFKEQPHRLVEFTDGWDEFIETEKDSNYIC